ncbi:MAG: hypothetical protein HQL68_11165 [Magnetococcales bacterium]|nr:hypothetical protein [Magnetococcales bacterium]
MSEYLHNINRINTIAKHLRGLLEEVVFLGGACIQFYLDDPELTPVRETKDIDGVFKVITKSEVMLLANKLRQLGFKEVSDSKNIYRWTKNKIIFDAVPQSEYDPFLEKNPWFNGFLTHSQEQDLIDYKIKILKLPYFIITKLDAHADRGKSDYLSSHDFEDIITIIEGRSDYSEFKVLPDEGKKYVCAQLNEIIQDPKFEPLLPGLITPEVSTQAQMVTLVLKNLKTIVEYCS